MLDRARPLDLAERGVNRHDLVAGNDPGQQDGHGLRVLAARAVDGDEGAGADHFLASRRHGNFGDAAGHGSASPAAARGPLYGPLESPGKRRPRTPDAGPRVHAVRNAGGAARAGRARNDRCRDRYGLRFVLTVGAGLGYGLSGEPGNAGRERVNRSDIAGRAAGRTGVGRSAAGDAVDAVFAAIAETRARGEDVRIVGFGTFGARNRLTPTGRNPRTGESMEIGAADRTGVQGRQAVAGCG